MTASDTSPTRSGRLSLVSSIRLLIASANFSSTMSSSLPFSPCAAYATKTCLTIPPTYRRSHPKEVKPCPTVLPARASMSPVEDGRTHGRSHQLYDGRHAENRAIGPTCQGTKVLWPRLLHQA